MPEKPQQTNQPNYAPGNSTEKINNQNLAIIGFCYRYLPLSRNPQDLQKFAEKENLNPKTIVSEVIEYLLNTYISEPEILHSSFQHLSIEPAVYKPLIIHFAVINCNKNYNEIIATLEIHGFTIPNSENIFTKYKVYVPEEQTIIFFLIESLCMHPTLLSHAINNLGLNLFNMRNHLIAILLKKELEENELKQIMQTYRLSKTDIEFVKRRIANPNSQNPSSIPETQSAIRDATKLLEQRKNPRKPRSNNHPQNPPRKPHQPHHSLPQYKPIESRIRQNHFPKPATVNPKTSQTSSPPPMPLNHLRSASLTPPFSKQQRRNEVMNNRNALLKIIATEIEQTFKEEIQHRQIQVTTVSAPPTKNFKGFISVTIAGKLRVIYKVLSNGDYETTIFEPSDPQSPQNSISTLEIGRRNPSEDRFKNDIFTYLMDLFECR